MKHNSKKILAVLIVLTMVTSCDIKSNLPDFEIVNDKFEFKLNAKKNGYILNNYIGDDSEIIVPNKCKELPIVEIKEGAFNGCGNIQKITIPFIGASAKDYENEKGLFGYIFGGNEYENGANSRQYYRYNGPVLYSYRSYIPRNLSEVVVSYGPTKINEFAFSGCRFLTSIVIPNSVKIIEDSAFLDCFSLESITLPNVDTYLGYYFGGRSASGNSYYVPSCLKEVILTEGKNIPDDAFYKCNSLASIKFTNNMAKIGVRAFSECGSLTSIVIPNSVTNIGNFAFEGCDSLTIYCEANGQPSGWESDWNSSNRPVYWGNQWSYVDGIPTPNK